MPRPLHELYKDILLDHARRPRNAGQLEDADLQASVVNPLCGDELSITLALRNERIREVRFRVRGCAIATASASMLSEQLQGLTLEDVARMEERFQAAIEDEAVALPEEMRALEPLLSVRDYPHRRSCARLAWDAFRALEKPLDKR